MKKLVTAKVLAEKLGFTGPTIAAWARSGKIPVALQVGGTMRFDEEAVIAAVTPVRSQATERAKPELQP